MPSFSQLLNLFGPAKTSAKRSLELSAEMHSLFKFHSEHAIFEKLIHIYLIDSLYRKTGSTRIL